VTLAGMFLARGVALALTADKRIDLSGNVPIKKLTDFAVAGFTMPALMFLSMMLAAMVIASYTRFGRSVYAVGGSESSAKLMGLRVGLARVSVFAYSGLCAALGGVAHAIGAQAGDASVGVLMELDAIAAVVIGGTLLSGGVGHPAGTLLGVLILGIITIIPSYQGNLNSWWTKIAIGGLLLAFIVLQRLLQRSQAKEE
jgi:simple sugar transport system permease protein